MCYGIFPTRNALKLTFVFFQFQLLAPAMYYITPKETVVKDNTHIIGAEKRQMLVLRHF